MGEVWKRRIGSGGRTNTSDRSYKVANQQVHEELEGARTRNINSGSKHIIPWEYENIDKKDENSIGCIDTCHHDNHGS